MSYRLKPSFKEKMKKQATKEGKKLTEFMFDVHYEYLKRKKAL